MTSSNSTESNKDTNQETTTTSSGYDVDTKPVETEGDKKPEDGDSNLDQYGYEKNQDDEKKPEEDDKKPEEGNEDDKVDDPASGYDKKPEEPDVEEDDDKKPEEDDKKPEGEEKELGKEDVESLVKELPDTYDKDSLSKFALENKFSKEQIEAYVKFAKEESEQIKKEQLNQVKITRKQWFEELKSDKEFGGELFDKNVHQVEKLLANHMPNVKKVLTERGSMLPPYLMKDLLSLSKALNPSTKLVNGEPSKSKVKEGNFLDEMYQ